MNENRYWRLASERRRALRDKEAKAAQLLREAGVEDIAPQALQALGLFLLTLPVTLLVALVVSRF
jgi:hypothetical protein